MDSAKDLIPKDKGDEETAGRLVGCSYEEVKPIVGELLTWIQDGNWPIAHLVGRFLSTIAGNLTSEIVTILQSNDGAWKYQTLRWLVEDHPLVPEVRSELLRLINTPSRDDIEEDIPELAQELLRRDGG
ncbi:MAG: DUF5071 domain-containing protein [Chitinophagaceae bacterium]|nr:MAG: DUF5071 domain-containing protein [Chitinophagaceae bacterium]